MAKREELLRLCSDGLKHLMYLPVGHRETVEGKYAAHAYARVEVARAVNGMLVSASIQVKDGVHHSPQLYVPVQWTPCRTGGRRPWWTCPVCGRRIGVLYHNLVRWACRACTRVARSSVRDTLVDRAQRKVNACLKALHASDDLFGNLPRRPRYMHTGRYARLLGQLSAAQWELEEAYAIETGKTLGILPPRQKN